MTPRGSDIARRRLDAQRLSRGRVENPAEVVSWLGAVQAQDYLGALWAVGLRLRPPSSGKGEGEGEGAVEQALADRTIVRTWPMRGTLHFVAAPDTRWMLKLLTPRVIARNTSRLRRQFGIDESVIARSRGTLQKALQGGRQLTRDGAYKALQEAGIEAAGQRGLHIVWWLAQEGLLCFGPRRGRQQTFVLLEEWLPPARVLERDEALAELARRYFTSHGPATPADFAWWSGLTAADAQAGLEMARSSLGYERFDGFELWSAHDRPARRGAPPQAHLLPAYDEYLVSYKERGAVLEALRAAGVRPTAFQVLSPTIVLDGQVVGNWKRTLANGQLTVTPHPFVPLAKSDAPAVYQAAERYGAFLGLPVSFQTR